MRALFTKDLMNLPPEAKLLSDLMAGNDVHRLRGHFFIPLNLALAISTHLKPLQDTVQGLINGQVTLFLLPAQSQAVDIFLKLLPFLCIINPCHLQPAVFRPADHE